MKDLSDDNRLDDRNLALIEMQKLQKHHQVKLYDLVFRSRGMTNTIALIDREVECIIVAAPLLRIRRKLIEDNLLDAVIGLPGNLFPTTSIPIAILVFDRPREKDGTNARRKNVFFVNANNDYLNGETLWKSLERPKLHACNQGSL